MALLTGEQLVIRNNPIAITVYTSASVDDAATLQFLLDAGWTSPVGFTPGLTPALGGTLDLEFATGVDPASLLGESFQLFDWNGLLPANDRFAMMTTEPGLTFDLSNLYSTGAISLTAVPEPSSLFLVGLAGVAMFGLFVKRKSPSPATLLFSDSVKQPPRQRAKNRRRTPATEPLKKVATSLRNCRSLILVLFDLSLLATRRG